jgi:capsid protein
MMTTGIASSAKAKVVEQLTGSGQLSAAVAALMDRTPEAVAVVTQNVAAELAERSGTVKYPAVNVYCEKIANELKEKFRSFSGKVEMAVEVRHSQDRLEGIEEALEQCADAITSTLNASRGDWGDGMFYSGGYEVSFGAVKRGGRNFTQVAKVTFEVAVSRN